jgi:hypothetical protein
VAQHVLVANHPPLQMARRNGTAAALYGHLGQRVNSTALPQSSRPAADPYPPLPAVKATTDRELWAIRLEIGRLKRG